MAVATILACESQETFRNEVFSAELEDLPTQAEHGVHVGSAKVEKTVVEKRVEFDLHGVRDAQRSGASARAITVTDVASTS